MTASNRLSIVPFLALVALLVAPTPCYTKAEFYDPATGEAVDGDSADEADTADEADEADEAADAADEAAADEVAAEEPGASDEQDEVVEPAECAFGETVSELADADHVALGAFEHLFRPQDLTDLELDQLAEGLDRFGWTDAVEIDSLFEEIDDSRLLVRELELLTTGQAFTHLRFHVDGVEFGFVFADDSFRLAAGVDAGDIVSCTVAL